MDVKDLFQNQSAQQDKKKIAGKARILFPDDLEYLPLTYGLIKKLVHTKFSFSVTPVTETADHLRQGSADLVLIPAIEYARRKEIWNLIPGLCVSAKGSIHIFQLFFKTGLKSISKIAVDSNAGSHDMLLKVIMREKFQLDPVYERMTPDLDAMLKSADAAFIVGQRALDHVQTHRNRLDLGEEWYDLTGLAYPVAFWAGRQFTIDAEDVQAITKSYELGRRNIEAISKEYAESRPENWSFYHDLLTQNLSYQFSEDIKDGLNELYNFAFYYGYIEHIPDLHFY